MHTKMYSVGMQKLNTGLVGSRGLSSEIGSNLRGCFHSPLNTVTESDTRDVVAAKVEARALGKAGIDLRRELVSQLRACASVESL